VTSLFVELVIVQTASSTFRRLSNAVVHSAAVNSVAPGEKRNDSPLNCRRNCPDRSDSLRSDRTVMVMVRYPVWGVSLSSPFGQSPTDSRGAHQNHDVTTKIGRYLLYSQLAPA
jgi:hypothetical protein